MSATNNKFELLTLERLQEIYNILSTSPPGAAVWGTITGTLSAQTDLQTALNLKYDASNPAGYITSAALSSYLTIASAASTYYPLTNPAGYITSASLTGYVPTSRTLNINGTSYDLSADRSWTVGDLLSSGSYADPSWLTSLAYSKLTGTPTLGTWAAVNYPAWVSGTPFVKMTAAGTFALDTNTYQTSNTTVFVGNANGAGITNGARGSIYLGGTPVATVAVTAGDYGSAAAAFMPGYPMPAGVASKMRVITRSANPATNSLQVYVANATASVLGAKVTIAAGSAAGVYATDDGTTVSFSNGDRLYCIAKNPNVVGGATSAQITTVSFNFSLS